jgi:hypothetical protein
MIEETAENRTFYIQPYDVLEHFHRVNISFFFQCRLILIKTDWKNHLLIFTRSCLVERKKLKVKNVYI